MSDAGRRPVVLVSSTVYGIEELLDRVYTLLIGFGYEVWMSHKGTLPVVSERTAFENCLEAVERCDLFLGILTPSYGSGQEGGKPSITHQEVLRAVELEKPRWFLTHSQVVYARRLLRDLGYRTREERAELALRKGAKALTDLRVIDMYEDAIRDGEPLKERKGNWAQEYETDEDALLFVTAQFSRFQEAEAFLVENFSDPGRTLDEVAEVREASDGRGEEE